MCGVFRKDTNQREAGNVVDLTAERWTELNRDTLVGSIAVKRRWVPTWLFIVAVEYHWSWFYRAYPLPVKARMKTDPSKWHGSWGTGG